MTPVPSRRPRSALGRIFFSAVDVQRVEQSRERTYTQLHHLDLRNLR